ncbi:MAG: LysR family transcriptional regulator [Chlamydiota bacterium]|nr:LysR family transcriptional regulator [Chlamydiota bacterium]
MAKLPLNLIYLKYFYDAVTAGSMAASAKQNFVTQSAISQGINRLEKSLDCSLIAHHANTFKLMPMGERVFRQAHEIFKAVSYLEDQIEENVEEPIGRLQFACMHSFALAYLPDLIAKLRKEYPKMDVDFQLGHTGIIKELLNQRKIDFGVVLDNEDLSGFKTHCIACGGFNLYKAKKVPETVDLPFILSEDRIETNKLRDYYHQYYGINMKILMRVQSWEVIANFVEEGLGIGFFPDYVARRRKDKLKKVVLPLPEIRYKIKVITHRESAAPHSLERFLAAMRTI